MYGFEQQILVLAKEKNALLIYFKFTRHPIMKRPISQVTAELCLSWQGIDKWFRYMRLLVFKLIL